MNWAYFVALNIKAYMKKFFSILLGCVLATQASAQQAYFLSNPSLTPDGQTVIFSFEGDLWTAALNKGDAKRLTAMEGNEINPRVSPDGQWIAFTGYQYGNADIFVMPINGGAIRQITFHSAQDVVTSWSWDSKYIYFNSNRASYAAGYKIALAGGTPVSVFGHNFFLYDHNLVEYPNTREIYFSDTWESLNQAQRKRYKGPFNPDIQSYNFATKEYKKYTTWEGKDFDVTIDKKGHVYFISDEYNGEYNLYTLKDGKKDRLTKFSTSIKYPQVNADGGTIVFEKDYQLWSYDVASGKAKKLNIEVYRNDVLVQDQDFDVKRQISNFDVSPDGEKLAFVSRGELFAGDVEGKFIQQIKRGNAERVSEVKWMKDNKTLLFSQTWNGYENWFTIAADGKENEKQLTQDKMNNRGLTMNEKRTMAVFKTGRNEIRLMDLKTMKSEVIVNDELWWGSRSATPGFSPNDEYILFTAYRNFEEDILIYNIKEKKTINLTNTGVSETTPIWSPDEKYIYFTSQRSQPSFPFGAPDAKVYRLALYKFDEPFKADKYNDLFKEEKPDTSAKKDKEEEKTKNIIIDTDHLMERVEQVSPYAGTQSLRGVYQQGDKTIVLYFSNHDGSRGALWKTEYEPFERPKTTKIGGTDNAYNFEIVQEKRKMFTLFNGTIYTLNLMGGKVSPIDISYTFRRNLSEEFEQMFYEAWAHMEENYYDGNFHGLNWEKTKEYYQQFLPYLNNRSDLRIMLNDMLGELNSSHQGFSSYGREERIDRRHQTMETGIQFEDEKPYTVKRIIRRSAADVQDIDIQPGDVLVKVNGATVDPQKDRNIYFTQPSLDDAIQLTFDRKGEMLNVRIHPQSSVVDDLYDEWIDKNQQRVDAKSHGRIAYSYMKNMGQESLNDFLIDMTEELNKKEALILDLRFNTGGNVHDKVLQFLSQRSYLQWKFRNGKMAKQPNYAPSDKPIVLLINEQSLSDAEMTTQGFKALKLGTIIGNATYRWIIFTSSIRLVDGSSIRMPAWGCYSLDGKDLESTGVTPDILVINSFEDRLNNQDPQLDKAIEVILNKLK